MSARNNARKKAGEVHGIAAAFGGAKDIFNSALSKGSGDEMGAMFKKTANDNQKDNKSANNNRSSPQTQSTGSVATFRPKQRPDDGTSEEVNNNVPANKTETNPGKIVESGFYKPGDIKTPANDNQPRSTGNNETTSKKTQEPEVRDTRRLDQRVKDAISKPELLPDDAKANLSGSLITSISDPTKLRDKDSNKEKEGEQGIGADNDNENFGDSEIDQLNRQILISEEEEDRADELQQSAEKLVFTPPFIMISITFIEYIFSLIIGLVGIVLTFILPPVGLIITIGTYIWKIGFGTVVFVWSYYYDSETNSRIMRANEINEMRKNLNKARKIQSIMYNKKLSLLNRLAKKSVGRGVWLVLGLMPIVGLITPTNFIIVLKASYNRSNKIREYNLRD